MERKFRVLTFNDKQYAWWHSHRDGKAAIMLSPINEKSTVIKVEFSCECSSDSNVIEYPAYIVMDKNNVKYRVKTLDPKMAGMLLEYLSDCNGFVSKHIIVLDGFKVLSDMGYHICNIEAGLDW